MSTELEVAILLLSVAFCLLNGASTQSVASVMTTWIEEEREFKNEPCDDYSNSSSFDFIIVGAGAAGSVLANRLTENGRWNVLLLEAGEGETFGMGIPLMANAARDVSDWNYTLEPMDAGCPLGPRGRCNYPRGKGMGGSTLINSMLYVRGLPADYDEWERQGNEGWGYQDVLKYFRKAENMEIPELRNSTAHGTDGPMPINYAAFSTRLTPLTLQAARENVIPEIEHNGGNRGVNASVSRIQTTTRRGQRWSANRAFLFGAKRRRNLFVRMRSLVTRVNFDPLNRRAVGVRYERDGVSRNVTATKEVLLCAGAINTPQLLMLSGVGPRNQLQDLGITVRRNLPVGQNLVDHTQFLGLAVVFNESLGPNNTEAFTNPRNFISYVLNGTGPWTSINSVEMSYYFQAGRPKYQSEPNMEMIMLQFPPEINFRNTRVNIYQNLTGRNAAIPVLIPLKPESKGNVSLASSNINDQPKIWPNFFGNQLDVRNAVAGINKLVELFRTPAFQEVGATLFDEKLPTCEEFEFASDDYWECAVKRFSITDYNPCCTCRMGPRNDSSAVVDPDLKVKGIIGLRVVDASVFPSMISGHLEASTIMAAEKAADLIKEAY